MFLDCAKTARKLWLGQAQRSIRTEWVKGRKDHRKLLHPGEEFTKIYLLQIKNDPKVPERLGTTKIEEKEKFVIINRKRDGTLGNVRNLT